VRLSVIVLACTATLRVIAQPQVSVAEPRPAEAAKPATDTPGKLQEQRSVEGTVVAVAKDGSSLRLQVTDDRGNQKVLLIQVNDDGLKDKLRGVKDTQTGSAPCTSPACSCICAGDKVTTKLAIDNNNLTLEDISPQVIQVSVWEPWIVMLVTAVVFLGITFVLSRGDVRGLLFIGEDNRYSNSKTQLSLWFGVVIVVYVSAFFMRWWHAGLIGHIGIPMNLLVLSGLSALTFAAAKGITSQKDADAQRHGQGGKTDGTPSFPGDLIRSDTTDASPSLPGQFDLGDFQMVVITLIAVASYIWIAANFLGNLAQCQSATLPDVDGTVLALFGVGQGAYLTKKAVSDVNH
jgi:hypothetical protein